MIRDGYHQYVERLKKDLEQCEGDLIDTIGTSILFLNCNGVPLDTVREMVQQKVDRAFEFYEDENVLERFKSRRR